MLIVQSKQSVHPLLTIPGCSLLIDPGVASSVTSSGGTISQIIDCAVGRPFVQATGAVQPALVQNVISTNPVIRWTWGNYLAGDTTYTGIGGSGFTIYFVGSFSTNPGADSRSLSGKFTGGTTGPFFWGNNGDNTALQFALVNSVATRITMNATTPVLLGTVFFGCYKFDGSNAYIYLNGVSDATPVALAGPLQSNAVTYYLGRLNNAANFVSGDWGLYATYNRATTTTEDAFALSYFKERFSF